jgi:hypothetical protein
MLWQYSNALNSMTVSKCVVDVEMAIRAAIKQLSYLSSYYEDTVVSLSALTSVCIFGYQFW